MNGASSSDANPSGVQGVCPSGWHIPSDAEWKELEMFLGMSQSQADTTGWRGSSEGGKLKETGTTHWIDPNNGATNSSGFTALPSGFKNSYGEFLHLSSRIYLSSSTGINSDNIWTRTLWNDRSDILRTSDGKSRGFPARCLRNLRSDTLIIIPGNEQVTLKWDTIDWQYLDKVYIYLDLVLTDSVEITSAADSLYTDTSLTNYQSYSYFIRMKDVWGDISISSDTLTTMPSVQMTDYDGNSYGTVKIGNQLWMRENLKTTHYSDGTALVDGTGAGDITGDYTTKYWFVYGDNPANIETYGLLYTWAAAMNGAASSNTNPSGVQGVCPAGWHLPGDSEWKELEMYLGMSQLQADGTGWRGTDEGGKMLVVGTSGFDGLFGGGRDYTGAFFGMSAGAYFQSSTGYNSSSAWYRSLINTGSQVNRDNSYLKNYGFSVRCLRDLFSDTLYVLPGNEQVTLKWDMSGWEYLDKIYVYRDLVMIDSVDITSASDSLYVDTGLTNYQSYSYFIRMKDVWGDISISSDTLTTMPSVQMTDYDGNSYGTVKIGNQLWMRENLKATHYFDGTIIPLVEGTSGWDALTSTDKAYCYYNNSITNRDLYGALYTWAAVMNGMASSDGNPSGVHGVCPNGWHMPSDAEWKELEMCLGMSQAEVDAVGFRGTDEGSKLKDKGTKHWSSPNTGATNYSGFTALPGGMRDVYGDFYSLGDFTSFSSATEYTINNSAWSRDLYSNSTEVVREGTGKVCGISVRCLRDLNDLFSDTLTVIPVNEQVTLKWDTIDWAYLDKVYIYRNLVLIDSVEINSASDTTYTDTSLTNYQSYSYFIRMKDIWGDMSITSDTLTAAPNIPVTDYDGNIYNTVKIGKQVWLKENLKTIHYSDGTPITLVEGISEWDALGYTSKAYCYYNNSLANGSIYGGIYSWAAAMNGEASSATNPSLVQGICPSEWHLPSDDEWKELEICLGMSHAEADGTDFRGTDEGGMMKETGFARWLSPNTGATNISGFTALGGGARSQNGTFLDMGTTTNFWSSTEYLSSSTYFRNLSYINSGVYRAENSLKDNGYSVRCLRDYDYLPWLNISSNSVNFGSISKSIADTSRSVYLKNTHADTIWIDSIYGADPCFLLDVPDVVGLTNIEIVPQDSVRLDITLHTEAATGPVTDTIIVHINSYGTTIIITAEVIVSTDTLIAEPGNQQVTLKWPSTDWQNIDKVYIYRNLALFDSIGVAAVTDTSYTDANLINYEEYNYFIRLRDSWGNLSIPSDTVTVMPAIRVTDFDGNFYNTVKIGKQVWMRENLKTTHFSDGNVIPLVEGQTEWDAQGSGGKAYCYYSNDTSNMVIYGALYNWAAAMNGAGSSVANPSGVLGVCPGGWHIPSDEEWKELEMF
jgi:uncharacterized protein (TIGR02145 family)